MPRDPDLAGPGRRKAWMLATDGSKTCLGWWLLHVPGAHPFWSWWSATLVHLRPVEGLRSPSKQYPAAEYELVSAALDPRGEPFDPAEPKLTFLHPFDLVFQFHGVSDRDACRVLHGYVRSIVQGGWSPDSDWRSRWERSLALTVRHLRDGLHPEH